LKQQHQYTSQHETFILQPKLAIQSYAVGVTTLRQLSLFIESLFLIMKLLLSTAGSSFSDTVIFKLLEMSRSFHKQLGEKRRLCYTFCQEATEGQTAEFKNCW